MRPMTSGAALTGSQWLRDQNSKDVPAANRPSLDAARTDSLRPQDPTSMVADVQDQSLDVVQMEIRFEIAL